MKIQINTENNVEGSDELTQQTQAVLESALERFAQQITRVEVHLNDENSSHKGGCDKRCAMEARLEGMEPGAVTDQAENMEQAVHGAADKLEKLLSHTLARLSLFPHCRRAFLSWCAIFLAVAFLGGSYVVAAPEAAAKSKQSPLEKFYGNWVAKDVDAKVGEVTIKLSFREEGSMKLVAWSELIFAGKVKETNGPYKVSGDTISSKAIRGGTKAKFLFEDGKLVLEFEDGKIVRFHRDPETR